MSISQHLVEPINVFFLYCQSADDKKTQQKVEKHLEFLESDTNYKREVGIEWLKLPEENHENEKEVNQNIINGFKNADIIVLFVNCNFININASNEKINFITLNRQVKEKGTELIPVILSDCLWDHTMLGHMKVLSRDEVGVKTCKSFALEIAKEIKKRVDDKQKERKKYLKNLEEYEEKYYASCRTENLITDSTRQEFNSLRQTLNIKPKDAAYIEEQINLKLEKPSKNKDKVISSQEKDFSSQIKEGIKTILTLTFLAFLFPKLFHISSPMIKDEIIQNADIQSSSPVEAVQGYFLQVNAGNREKTWEQLAESYKLNPQLKRNYQIYTNWWNSVKLLEITEIYEIKRTQTEAQVFVHWRYCSKRDSKFYVVKEKWQLTKDPKTDYWIFEPETFKPKKEPKLGC